MSETSDLRKKEGGKKGYYNNQQSVGAPVRPLSRAAALGLKPLCLPSVRLQSARKLLRAQWRTLCCTTDLISLTLPTILHQAVLNGASCVTLTDYPDAHLIHA